MEKIDIQKMYIVVFSDEKVVGAVNVVSTYRTTQV